MSPRKWSLESMRAAPHCNNNVGACFDGGCGLPTSLAIPLCVCGLWLAAVTIFGISGKS